MQKVARPPSYLIRNPHSYCFRMIVPKDLQSIVGKRELRYSLRTGYLSTAKSKARLMAGQIQLLFNELRRSPNRFMELTDKKIREMVTKHLERAKALMDEPFGSDDGDRPFDDEASLAEYVQGLDDVRMDIQVELTTGKYWRVKDDAISLLNEFGVSTDDIDADSNAFVKLCEGLLRANLKELEYHKDRLTGTYSDDLEAEFDSVLGKPSRRGSIPLKKSAPRIQLSALITKYVDENKRAKNWSDRTETEYASVFRNILRLFGNVTLDCLTMESTCEIKEVLLKLPLDYFKATTKYQSVSAAQAARENGGKKLSVTTVNKYLDQICALFRYAVKHGFMEKNYADGLKIRIKSNANTERLPFSEDDLVTLFSSPGYRDDTFKTAWRFWLPILALYTGCRLEELCQLIVADIQEVDGMWFIDIKGDQEAGQRVKTETSVRKVPLHPFLIEDLRFPDFVKSVVPKGDMRLWKELKQQGGRWGHYPSRDFGSLKRELGITDQKKVFHSFRHNFQNTLKQKGVRLNMIDELVGHALQGETLGRYTQEYPVQILYKEAILKLDYGIDLSHLKASNWVPRATDGPE